MMFSTESRWICVGNLVNHTLGVKICYLKRIHSDSIRGLVDENDGGISMIPLMKR